MFVYLSKKIAIPHNLHLQVISWNISQGWIACGGERGLLKVIKLDSSDSKVSNLSMNQTLEGHHGNICVVTWNENFRKLTTSDQNGLIIVWILHRGIWFEEMINNRNRSVVRDMKWTVDGSKICIVYEDGAVIVGTVDGQRLWGKELKTNLALLEWGPDGRSLLFCTLNGEVHLYDPDGNYVLKVPVYCLDNGETASPLSGLHWWEGASRNGIQSGPGGGIGPPGATTATGNSSIQNNSTGPLIPSLAIAYENGRVQILKSEADDRPVLIDTQMRCTGVRWNPAGTIIALSGMQLNNVGQEVGVVQFYGAQHGEHLRTLRVPGNCLRSLSWEGTGLRLALAVDSHIFFANVRPDYLWDYFQKTVVYAAPKKERSDFSVVFWNTSAIQAQETHSGSTATPPGVHIKQMRHVQDIKAHGEYCVVICKTDENAYELHLCNEIGSPVEKREVILRGTTLNCVMTKMHIIVTTTDTIYVWMYFSSTRDMGSKFGGGNITSKKSELMFHIDDPNNLGFLEKDQFQEQMPIPKPVTDPIATLAASETVLMISRESGVVQTYQLPFLQKDARFQVRQNPQIMALNCNCTKLILVDLNGILSLYCVDKSKGQITLLDFERKDVWNAKWSLDSPDLFCFTEKTRMYVVRGISPEEPVLTNGYICEFNDLEIRSVLMDDLMRTPEQPRKEHLLDFETKSLRDTRDILTKLSNLKDAFNFCDDNPHPRLWRLLAEAALDALEFSVAEKAFVKFEDYSGIQFVKRLKLLSDKVKQRAEICTYFQRFDEAEALYREIDRRDLAVELRVKLGDWFRVIQLVQGSGQNENLLKEAWNSIGEYYSDRGKWSHAAQYLQKGGNHEGLIEAFYSLEDYDSLSRFIPQMPEGSPLLRNIAEKLISVGLCDQGVKAYLRLGDVSAAIDSCVLLNEWDLGLEIARQQKVAGGQTEELLSKCARHFLEKGDMQSRMEAVQLFRKANRWAEASRLLHEIGGELQSLAQKAPDKLKKVYLLAALEMEKRKSANEKAGLLIQSATKDPETTTQPENKAKFSMQSVHNTADGLSALTQMMEIGMDKNLVDTKDDQHLPSHIQPWRACEAFHLLKLCQKQIYEGTFDRAMRTAIRLTDYEEFVSTQTIYSLVAFTTFQNKFYLQCSKAFIKLAKCGEKWRFEKLAINIFKHNQPRDGQARTCPCPNCGNILQDFMIQCNSCSTKLPFCVTSGRTIFSLVGQQGGSFGTTMGNQVPPPVNTTQGMGTSPSELYECKTCRRKSYNNEIRNRISCALCHSKMMPRLN